MVKLQGTELQPQTAVLNCHIFVYLVSWLFLEASQLSRLLHVKEMAVNKVMDSSLE